jgi:hypothetical protein
MRRFRFLCAMTLAAALSLSTHDAPAAATDHQAGQTAGLERALGRAWHSAEQFEGEARVQFALRRQGNDVVGWLVMLGQERKGNNHTVLALSFCNVRWDGDRARFDVVLPDDEGTLGWELQQTGDTTGVLSAVTENGSPLPDPIVWDVSR